MANSMLKLIHTLACCLLLFFQTGWAQSPPINFTSLSARDGLLSNTVNAIIKDHYGLMWFATDDGLNKFDGTNFTVYRHIAGDASSLRANEVLALHEDKSGNLWVGTSGGGLSRYDRQKDAFVHYPLATHTQELPSNAVIRSICSDYLGNIWVAQYEYLFLLDPKANKITRLDLDAGSAARVNKILICVFEDSQHRIWTGTNNGLYLYDRKARNFRRFTHDANNTASLLSNDIRAIAEDNSGLVWIGTPAGLCAYRKDGSGFQWYPHLSGTGSALSNNEINCLARDDEGQLWIGTSRGLNILNTVNHAVTIYLPEENNIHSLTSQAIKCAYIDQQGIYWLGTFRGGINKYDKNLNLFGVKLSSDFHEKGQSISIVSSFAENRDGTVIIGTDGGGLFFFNRKTDRVQPLDWALPVSNSRQLSVLAMHRSTGNQLYIGTYANGLIVTDLVTGKNQHFVQGPGADNLTSNDLFCLKEDSKGQIWVGTNGQGINVLKNGHVTAKHTPLPRPGMANEFLLPINGYIRTIEEDKSGNIWVGSHGGGLAVYHPANGEWTIYTQANSQLASDKVQVLLCDSDGQMWVGTYGEGLSLFDPKQKKFTTFSEKDGLPNTTIYQIVEDKKGQLWLSTNTGISSFDRDKRSFRNYTPYNGVQNNNFVHTSGMLLSDGELIFGGLQGFNYFNPAQLTINKNVPQVLLTDLRISHKSVTAGEEAPINIHVSIAASIHLAYKQNFALSFVALNYTIPKQNHYAYKLEGFDKDWNYIGTSNTASYTNLDPGEYTFHVKASNNDGVWSAKDTTIKIYVQPPWWRTTWAYLLYVLVTGGLLLYSRYRGIARIRKQFALEQERQEQQRVRELDRLKIKFLTNLSHDFRTPISLIMGPVDQLIVDERTDNKLNKLQMIRRNARRLLNLVNQLLYFRKMEEHELKLQVSTGEFVSFVREASDSFRDFAERKHIQFEFRSGLSRLDALFDHDKMERILFNLLSNAFKFTLEGGTVLVELQEMPNPANNVHQWVTLTIKDSGIGIPAEKREQIFERFFQHTTTPAVINQGTGIGLSITEEFIRMHGGTIDVNSEPGQGSTFTVQLPLTPVMETAAALPPALPEATTPVEEEMTAATADIPAVLPDSSVGSSLPLVLLVEDNEDFRFYLKDNLRTHYKILEASNGKEGWQKALANHPQLIVSDITMPEMDGISLVQKLKADKRTGHIPVILLTALTAEEQQIAGLETGANDYITKPFNFEVLHAKIRNLLHLNDTLKNTYTRQIKVLAPEVMVESADEKLLSRITSYLEENLTDSQLSVERLSKEVGMSRSTLYNKLLELTGQTPVEYIRSYRLDKAASLLEKSDITIAEIAYQVGFSTPNYFARSFKTRFNMLPSEFVAKKRKNNSQHGD
jgi:signal transduction histidine kinase/DNA-binding response OmpR family regulator/streptogramin lyase